MYSMTSTNNKIDPLKKGKSKWLKDYCCFSIIAIFLFLDPNNSPYGTCINAFVLNPTTRWNVAPIVLRSSNHDNDALRLSLIDEKKFHTLPRIYVGELPSSFQGMKRNVQSTLREKSRTKLSRDQTHYLVKVMRFFKKGKKKRNSLHPTNFVTIGDENVDINQCVRIFDGVNGEWLARIIKPSVGDSNTSTASNRSRKHDNNRNDELEAECLIQLQSQHTNECGRPWILFAPIKKQRLKLMVEKCTELGTALFCPIMTDHTDTALVTDMELLGDQSDLFIIDNGSKSTEIIDKLPLIAREASEQSERLDVPTFITSLEVQAENGTNTHPQMITVESLLESLDTSPLFEQRTLMVCRERQHEFIVPILTAFDKSKHSTKNGGVVFLIGPEGGWSEHENYLFDKYNKKYNDDLMMCVSLGSSVVLRAETCCAMAVGSYALWLDSLNLIATDKNK